MSYRVENENGTAFIQTQEKPIEVVVKNFSDRDAKPPTVKKTSVRTYIIDPAAVGVNTNQQISDYEPRRLRMVIQVIDQPVTLTTEAPVKSPEPALTAAGPAPQGRYLPNSTAFEYIFYGPDAMWLNSITGSTVTRVTVTKEFC